EVTSLLGTSLGQANIERIIWFTNNPPPSNPPSNPDGFHTFYRQASDGGSGAYLGCGQYAVVGPRKVTRLGWSHRAGTGDYSGPFAFEPSKQKMILDPDSGRVCIYQDNKTVGPYLGPTAQNINYPQIVSNPAAPATGDTIQQPLPIIVGAGVAGSI